MSKTFGLVLIAMISISVVVEGAQTATGKKVQDQFDKSVLSMLSVNTEYVVDDILELLNSFANTVQE